MLQVRNKLFLGVITLALLSPAVSLRSQTWSPTVASCTYAQRGGSSVSNPDGPLTPEGGDAYLSSVYAGIHPVSAICHFRGFPDIVPATATRLSFYVYESLTQDGDDGAYTDFTVSWFWHQSQGTGPIGPPYSNPPQGLYSLVFPLGTNLSSIDIQMETKAGTGFDDLGNISVGYISIEPVQ